MVNSGYRQIHILTQYMAGSLILDTSTERGTYLGYEEFIGLAPAQMRQGEFWYRGTADSIYQNLNLIHDSRTDNTAVFGGDHIYKCGRPDGNVSPRCQRRPDHRDISQAEEEAHQFGIIEVDAKGRVVGFEEKPADPKPIPGQPDTCLVSMGNYFFKTNVLEAALHDMAAKEDTSFDFGKDIIPALLAGGAPIYVRFSLQSGPRRPGGCRGHTGRMLARQDSYFKACMELRNPVPNLNMYNREWRISHGSP